jgi:hypothetical protein
MQGVSGHERPIIWLLYQRSTDRERVATARQLLADLGVTLADLHLLEPARRPVPTMDEYLPEVVEAAGSGALRTYGTYWARMARVGAGGG